MSEIVLTEGQRDAYGDFINFLIDPDDQAFVLAGYAGTGKSTLVNTILDELPETLKTANLLGQKKHDWTVQLTATTNKAAEALQNITSRPVSTIHSFLGLRVDRNWETGETTVVPRKRGNIKEDYLIFIDEASYVDSNLLKMIFEQTNRCKLVFIGDPAQLAPVKSSKTPVFHAGFTTAELTEVVRQAEGNPIIDLATRFRNTVNTGEFFKFSPDQANIIYLDRTKFDEAIIEEFTREDWQHNDSKVLAWTNKRVIGYNHGIREVVKGMPDLQVGDYAVCNQYIANKHCQVKTDQSVCITNIVQSSDLEVPGWDVEMDDEHHAFLPEHKDAEKQLIRRAKAEKDYARIQYIETNWIDLRAEYACTINKSQGSTYKKVFVDLDDIGKCNSGNTIARMLYVAVSRASETVYLTGDLV